MNTPSLEPRLDVIIASQRDDFWNDVQAILQGYYPYEFHFMRDTDAILNPTASLTPLLALVDGHGGTLNASEWAQSIKMSYPECPLIVLYGPEDLLDFELLKKNGANHIMHTSYDREFVSDMVLSLAPVDLRGNDIPVSALLPIDINDINPEEEINFDVFIHLPSNHKSFRVRKDGGKIDPRLLEKSSETHQHLYIKKTQLKEFFEYARTVLTQKNLPDPTPQTERVYKSKQLIHEIISEFLNSDASDFQTGKVIFERCRMILTELHLNKEKDTQTRIAEIYKFAGHPRSTYQDALSMAVFASNFSAFMGWDADKIESAALAGLLHNVGLAKMPSGSVGKSFKELSPEQLLDYKIYPDRSVILIKSKKVPLPPEAAAAIVQHQENADGSGFPHGLDSSRLDPLGKILRLSMRFLELTALDGEQLGKTPKAALKHIREESLAGKAVVDLITLNQVLKKLGT